MDWYLICDFESHVRQREKQQTKPDSDDMATTLSSHAQDQIVHAIVHDDASH